MPDKKVTKPEPVPWGPCPKGEWQRLTQTLRGRRRKALLVNIIAIVATAAIIAGVIWMLASPQTSDPGAATDHCPSTVPACSDTHKTQK